MKRHDWSGELKPYYQDKWVTIYHGDCREILPQLDLVSGIVTDPPYELGFMGKVWDKQGISFQVDTWRILREVCKLGAMLLSFGGTRTFHRIAVAIEDAGWELRDTIMWIYGSGFPKSLDIGKAIDKLQGNEREIIGKKEGTYADIKRDTETGQDGLHGGIATERPRVEIFETKGNSPFEGYGTALKPAYEPILVCMNPLDGTFANNALKHGVAGLNIDGCRIGMERVGARVSNRDGITRRNIAFGMKEFEGNPVQGRFPANIIHDGSDEVLELFPNSKPTKPHKVYSNIAKYEGYGTITQKHGEVINYAETEGSAARFFYCAKASKSERNAGCEGLPLKAMTELDKIGGEASNFKTGSGNERNIYNQNNHPTVKPLALMKYLVKLISPPKDAILLDPFMGSGTTLLACKQLGIKCIGIELDEYTCEIAAKRCCQEVMELRI